MPSRGVVPTLIKRRRRGDFAGAKEDRSARLARVDGGARLRPAEVSMLKKLILRALYSSAAMAALVFILSAHGKHPK
jgi:hypothetical protein